VKSRTYNAKTSVKKNVSFVAESQDAVINANNGTGSAVVLEAGNESISGFAILAGRTGVMVGLGTKDEPVYRIVSRNETVNALDNGIFVYRSNYALNTENMLVNNYCATPIRNSNSTVTRNLFENNSCGITGKEDKNNAVGIDLGWLDDSSFQIARAI
jgi:hypothetical protein